MDEEMTIDLQALKDQKKMSTKEIKSKGFNNISNVLPRKKKSIIMQPEIRIDVSMFDYGG